VRRNYQVEKFIVDNAIDLLKDQCTTSKDKWYVAVLPADTVASHVRRHLFLTRMMRNPEFVSMAADDVGSYEAIIDHRVFSELLRAVASCYGLNYIARPSMVKVDPMQIVKLEENLKGEFSVTQASSLSGDDWPLRMVKAKHEDEFWNEAAGAIDRYFEYAQKHWNELLEKRGRL
jgi:hypothetical protein